MPDNINSDTPGSEQGFNYDFLQNLEAIQANTDALNTMLPKQFAALSATLVDVYSKSGAPSRGAAARPVPGISGFSSLSGTTDASARAQLAGDQTEQEVEGATMASPMGGRTWQARVRQGGLGQILPMPRFPGAQPNANDLLNYASTVAANIAQGRQNTLDTRAADKQAAKIQALKTAGSISVADDGTPQGLGGTALPSDLADQITEAGATSETSLGKVSDAFSGLENAYAQGKYIKGIISKVTAPAASTRAYGYESGYAGGSQPSFLGMRSPLDSGVIAGLGQRASQMGFSLANNVTPGQGADIYNNMFSRGWYGGGSTNDMRTAAASMVRTNPMIGTSPAYYDMMDKATRQGASSLEQFNAVMKQIPDAAKAAHTSITDTMAQMDAMGSYNATIGGTYAQGQQNSLAWQQTTGLPTAIMQQLEQNPMVQGQTFAHSGLMPQMQGLASPFQHMQGIMGSLNLLNRAIIPPSAKSSVDPITGLTQTISGQDQKEALLSSQLNIPKDVVHTMLANKSGWMQGAGLLNAGQAYDSSVTKAVQGGNRQTAYNDLVGKPWAGIQKAMKNGVDSQGHKIFEDWDQFRTDTNNGMSAKQAHAQAQLFARRSVTNAGDPDILRDATQSQLSKALKAAGVTGAYGATGKQDAKSLLSDATARQRATAAQSILNSGNVSSKMMADVSRDRKKKMSKYITENTQKFGTGNTGNNGPSLQIELGPAAKKMFHLSNPNGQQKANTNAGSAAVNLNSYVSGPTAAPTPDLNTSSGTTYNYGGPDDFSSGTGG